MIPDPLRSEARKLRVGRSRFSSVAMDEAHLIAAARYVPMNPVRARLAERARDWPWSSAGGIRGHDTQPLCAPRQEIVQRRGISGLIRDADGATAVSPA